MRVVVRAPLLSISGYGQHSRQVFEAASRIPGVEIFTQIVQWGNTSWFLNSDLESGMVGNIMKKSTELQSGFDVSLQVQLPDEWSTSLARINIGVTAAVETDKCNPTWVESCNKMNAVVVPSEFTKRVLEDTGKITTPIYVIPEWFIPEINEDLEPLDISLRTDFNFLIVSQTTSADPDLDRKNIANTIKWICETFKDDKRVGIVLKTNNGRGTALDKVVTKQILQGITSQVRKTSSVPIYLLHGNMTNYEISSLYRHPKIKALVSLTRGEGFGLPLLEAAASGLPVIATDWSAHTEFLNLGKWIKIESEKNEIPAGRVDGRIFISGTKWANVDEQNFKRKIKKFRESYEMPRQWALELKSECKNKFSRESILKTYESFFKEIIDNA